MNQATLPGANTSRIDSLRRTATFDYLLHIVGILLSLGTLSVLALVINYIKRPSARGTIFESHFTWQIRTFWWTIFWFVVLAIPFLLLTALTFGLLSFLFVLPLIWFLYRMIKGLLWLNDGKEMPV
ncbi:MAG: hypothetical protein ABWZ78_17655 [Burkholderiaceae bacterium]|jgi:uncharacterized membrane protein